MQLLAPLFGFGNEKPEDAVDSVIYLTLGVISDGIEAQKVLYI